MKRLFQLLFVLALGQPMFAQEWVVDVPYNMGFMRDMVPVDAGEHILGIGGTNVNYRYDGLVLMVEKDGQYVDRQVHLPGMTLQYHSAVQLGNGNYMVFGLCEDSLRDPLFQQYLRVDVFNGDLEIVSSRTYDVDDDTFDYFYGTDNNVTMKSILSKSGSVILACKPTFCDTSGTYLVYRQKMRFYEFDEDGEILRVSDDDKIVAGINELFYAPHSDNLMISVQGSFPPNDATGLYIADTNLAIIARKDFFHLTGGLNPYGDRFYETRCEGRWFDGDCVIYDAYTFRYDGKDSLRPTFYYDKLYKLDSALNVLAELRLPPYDSCSFSPESTSTAYVDDTTIFAFTFCRRAMHDHDMQQLNVILVDKDLNLLGRKVIRKDDVRFSMWAPPAAFDDGGCLAFVRSWNGDYYPGDPFKQNQLMKFRRADIEITWDMVEENSTASLLSPYPNPTNGILNIPMGYTGGHAARLQIFDMKGEKCFDCAITKQGNLITVDTQNLEAGLYVYKLLDGNREVANGKFVKE